MQRANGISLKSIRDAAKRIAGIAYHTPLVPFNVLDAPAEIHLKLENLQPVGSFKVRGSANAMLLATPEDLAGGVCTASAGNMAQGVAWNARRMGIACSVVVPDHAPDNKLEAIKRLGGKIIKVSFEEWWQAILTHQVKDCAGMFIHPVSDRNVMAGNGTIGLEILDDLSDVDTVLIPYGGGGLSCGIASAIKALSPTTKVFACEVETAAPLSASLAAGAPTTIPYTPSFVDGIGGKSVLEEMWQMASQLLDGSIVVSLAEIAAAIRLLAQRNRVIAEGAGAASVAAALSGKAPGAKIACVISGGNIDVEKLAVIFNGNIP